MQPAHALRVKEGAFLATAQFRINKEGWCSRNIRALCDPGAQVDIISGACARKHGLHIEKTDLLLQGVNGPSFARATGVATADICSSDSLDVIASPRFVVLPDLRLTLPSQPITDIIAGLKLADPSYNDPRKVEAILGAGTCAAIILESAPRRQMNNSIALHTRLGWIVFGSATQQNSVCAFNAMVVSSPSISLDEQLLRFWECEDLGGKRQPTADEKWCEQHFRSTHYRDESGRYVVELPLKKNISHLGTTFEVAKKRFWQLERRLSRDENLRVKYISFMRELEQLGHMQKCTRAPEIGRPVYHIPHHSVVKKFRVVFDASCVSTTGISLNDVQHAGGRLQDDLVQIIQRFRTFPVAITADVVKMFRQVRVHESQWDLQRIFWRESPDDPLSEFWITTVIYGQTSSSFNAVRALQQAAHDSSALYPAASNAIVNHFYVDDLLTGAEDASAAQKLCSELSTTLSAGGFELDKWASNCPSVKGPIERFNVPITVDEASVLGLSWSPADDVLRFKFRTIETPAVITKRIVVSAIAKLFDPVGFLGPIIVRGKSLIQDLWRVNVSWDEPLPADLEKRWLEYNGSLDIIEKLEIPRWLRTSQSCQIELHGFADASSIAYGAVIFIRVTHADGIVTSSLLSCKTRIAPVKTISIPRLELCAAELMGRQMLYTQQVFDSPSTRRIFWTDSEVVLCWIRKLPCTLKTFVANRVASIQHATAGAEWRHVASRDNPADIASRGASAKELSDCRLWWNGPVWLSLPEDNWPPTKRFTSISIAETARLEQKTPVAVIANLRVPSLGDDSLLKKLSTLSCILRITAYILRFPRNVRAPLSERQFGLPTSSERDAALIFWIRCAQADGFREEITAMKRGASVPSRSVLKTLVPFLGESQVLRLGGRLQNSTIPYESMHPMILPGKSRIALLLVREAHFRTLHGGTQVCMQYLRQRYWITNMRRLVKAVINRCVTCVRHRRQSAEQLMASLPSTRVQPCRAFKRSGVDYAGPVTLKAKAGRTRMTTKGYIALFVCLVTRAIHLEAVSDLTVGAFMAAFHRFISRRGQCALLLSDNGTTFVGADNAMRRISQVWSDKSLAEQIEETGTEWRFITPAAPHQGGIWEAGVKSTKHHLRRVMGAHVFTFETLTTVLARIEACLNSRPLAALSDDASDFTALTPGHFLVGEQLVQPLTKDLSDVPDSRLKLWGIVHKITQCFWKRWYEEYLVTMQRRNKWFRPNANMLEGDLVLIMDENHPPTMWPMGRVSSVRLGDDGLTRSCVVRTAKTELCRPVQKLCLLPVRDDQADV